MTEAQVMICNVSPAKINVDETLSSLRFAERAKKIENKAMQQMSRFWSPPHHLRRYYVYLTRVFCGHVRSNR